MIRVAQPDAERGKADEAAAVGDDLPVARVAAEPQPALTEGALLAPPMTDRMALEALLQVAVVQAHKADRPVVEHILRLALERLHDHPHHDATLHRLAPGTQRH